MIEYNTSFIISGIILSVIMLFSFRRYKQTTLRSTKFFISLVIINLFAGLFELLEIASMNRLHNNMLTLLSITGYFICHFMCAILMLLYIYSFNSRFVKFSTVKKVLISAPFIIGELLIITNLFTKFVFEVDESGKYIRHIGIWLIYVIAAIYMLLTAYTVIRHRMDFTAKLRIFILLWIAATAFAMLIQMFLPGELVETFAVTASALIMFLNIQSPHELFDNETGLFNRVTFMTYVNYMFSMNKRFTVVEIVLDDFAAIGRAFGVKHSATALKKIVYFLEHIDKNTKLYLTENNVFTAILQGDSEKNVSAFVDQIHRKFSETWHIDENEMMLSVRTCTISVPKDADDSETLYDIMGCFSKENTGNPINVASDIKYDTFKAEAKLKMIFEKATDENKLKVKYIPIYSFAQKRYTAAKAVVYIHDDELGDIYSNDCISVYSQIKDYLRIGEFVLDNTCRFINDGKLPKKGIECIVIRLPIAKCMQPDFISHFIAIRNEYRISNSLISFEIAEKIVDEAGDDFSDNLMHLFSSGAKLCLSEYGTGFTNISYIYDLPIDCIRIDKKMVIDSVSNKKVRIALESTLKLIRELGIKTMVEGIDTKIMYDAIKDLPCDYAEGSYFSEPVSELEFIEMISEEQAKQINNTNA